MRTTGRTVGTENVFGTTGGAAMKVGKGEQLEGGEGDDVDRQSDSSLSSVSSFITEV